MGNLSRARLARAAGVGLETIRFYEKQGLLPVPMRSGSGYRQYTESDIARLKFIAKAKSLGFTLHETSELLSIGKHPQVICPDLRQRAELKIAAIESKIQDLNRIRKTLMELVECCANESSDCEDKENNLCTSLITLGESSQAAAVGTLRTDPALC